MFVIIIFVLCLFHRNFISIGSNQQSEDWTILEPRTEKTAYRTYYWYVHCVVYYSSFVKSGSDHFILASYVPTVRTLLFVCHKRFRSSLKKTESINRPPAILLIRSIYNGTSISDGAFVLLIISSIEKQGSSST